MTSTGSCEIINRTVDPVFTNTAEDDLAFYTSSSNQSIHFGTQIGNTAPSALKVTKSNIEVNGDIALTRGVLFNGLQITKKATAGTMQNVTATVTSVPSLSSNVGNVTLSLGSGQSNFRFVNSNSIQVASLSQTGVLELGTVTATSVTTTNLTANGVNMVVYPACRYETNASDTAIETNIKYVTQIYDTLNNYNTTTGLFTAPVKGIYIFTAAANNRNGSKSFNLKLHKIVGAVDTVFANYYHEDLEATSTLSVIANITGVVNLNVGEQVCVRCAGASAAIPTNKWYAFTGTMLTQIP
jgi:hypothetical protein